MASWQTAINGIIVALVACIAAFMFAFPFPGIEYEQIPDEVLEEASIWYGAITWVIAAYLYHYNYLIRQFWKQKKQAKAK